MIGFAGVIVVSMNGQKIDMNLSLMGDGVYFLCAISICGFILPYEKLF